MVVAPIAQATSGLIWNFEVTAAEKARHRPVVDALELHHQARLARAAPFHLELTPVKNERGSSLEAIVEVCQGIDLDSTVETVGTEHLADPDHEPEPPPCSRRSRGDVWLSDGLARSTNTRLRSRSDATRTSVLTASMLRPALPMKRPTSPSASLTLMATVPPPRSNASTCTSSGFSASVLPTYSTSARSSTPGPAGP